MNRKTTQYLTQIANYLNVPRGKLTLDSQQMPTCVVNNTITKGFLNIVLSYLNGHTENLLGNTEEDKAEIYQMIEYALVYCMHTTNVQSITDILTGLNVILSTRTYLVSTTFTISDVLLYYVLQNVMESITYLEKEKFINVSRWFDNLQQDMSLRQSNDLVDFSTCYLSTVAPARH